MGLLIVCHKCPRRGKPEGGRCPCTVDGVDIIDHARTGECPEARFPARGLGDVVAKVTAAVGVKPCAPCKRRRDALNRLLPFKAGR